MQKLNPSNTNLFDKKPPNTKKDGKKFLYPKFPSWHQKDSGNFKISSKKENEIDENIGTENNSLDKKKEIEKLDIVEFSDDFREGMFVMTEWGPGKVANVNKADKTCKIKIEDQTVSFPFDNLKASLNIFLCIVEKSKQYWGIVNVKFTDTVKNIRIKIGQILNVHYSQVILLKNGNQLRNNNRSILDLDLFEKEELLVVIKDESVKRFIRFKSDKIVNFNSGFNSISFTANEDILLLGMDLYKNTQIDIFYNIKIIGEKLNVLFEQKNIQVEKYEAEEEGSKKSRDNLVKKYEFELPILIKKNIVYEIQQIISYDEMKEGNFNLKGQYIGYSVDENSYWDQAEFNFIESKGIQIIYNKNNNMTSVNQGLIPSLYYIFKTK